MSNNIHSFQIYFVNENNKNHSSPGEIIFLQDETLEELKEKTLEYLRGVYWEWSIFYYEKEEGRLLRTTINFQIKEKEYEDIKEINEEIFTDYINSHQNYVYKFEFIVHHLLFISLEYCENLKAMNPSFKVTPKKYFASELIDQYAILTDEQIEQQEQLERDKILKFNEVIKQSFKICDQLKLNKRISKSKSSKKLSEKKISPPKDGYQKGKALISFPRYWRQKAK